MNLNDREKLVELFEKYGNLLTQAQRQTFQLYYFEDLSLQEISKIVASTRSGVYDALKKSRNKLLVFDKKIND